VSGGSARRWCEEAVAHGLLGLPMSSRKSCEEAFSGSSVRKQREEAV
jgi:hypothetical protein